MRRKLLVWISLAGLLLLMLPGQRTYATADAPHVLVNDATRECVLTWLNDECTHCTPKEGWREVRPGDPLYEGLRCPDGFTEVHSYPVDCQRFKSENCCGAFISHGSCQDMVVNATLQACAFVSDIRACAALPQGWTSRPTDIPEVSWGCTFKDYKWVENVSCLSVPPTPEPLLVDHAPNRSSSWLPIIGGGLIVVGGGMLAWLMRRRKRF